MTRAILILAAGASSRMRGRDKLLEDVGGEPLLREIAKRALAVCDTVFVTLPAVAPDRKDALASLGVQMVPVPKASDGIAESIKAGAIKAGQSRDLMILPADLPEITSDDLRSAWDCFDQHGQERIVRATDQAGNFGHPTIFPKTYTPELNKIIGDKGAAKLISKIGFVSCQFPNDHATTDLDTPEDWANWRKK